VRYAHLHFLISAGEVSDSAAILASAICWSPKHKIKSHPLKIAHHTLSFMANITIQGKEYCIFLPKKTNEARDMDVRNSAENFVRKQSNKRGDIKVRMKGLC
jgi:hypothetical protein